MALAAQGDPPAATADLAWPVQSSGSRYRARTIGGEQFGVVIVPRALVTCA